MIPLQHDDVVRVLEQAQSLSFSYSATTSKISIRKGAWAGFYLGDSRLISCILMINFNWYSAHILEKDPGV